MKPRAIGGHHRPYQGKSNDWLTPPELVQLLGPFDLDPCASIGQPWKTAAVQYTVDTPGLSNPWYGFAWVNPPYGPHVGMWLARLADHRRGIALVFARTETDWFHKYVWGKADAVFFPKGRFHFHRPRSGERMKHNAGAGSVLVAYGVEAAERIRTRLGGELWEGRYVDLWRNPLS